ARGAVRASRGPLRRNHGRRAGDEPGARHRARPCRRRPDRVAVRRGRCGALAGRGGAGGGSDLRHPAARSGARRSPAERAALCGAGTSGRAAGRRHGPRPRGGWHAAQDGPARGAGARLRTGPRAQRRAVAGRCSPVPKGERPSPGLAAHRQARPVNHKRRRKRMMRKSGIKGLTAVASTAAVLLGAGGSAQAEDIVIRMAVPDWPPTRIMQDLANERYKAPSGNNVRLEADFIPWPNYYERLAASLTSGEQKYQMAVSDSQWLGAFVEGGYYMKINDFIDADPELQEVFADLHPNLVDAYSTYPHKSDNYYGFPQMPDVLIVYYRQDVFCHEDEQAAFQEKYGYKLPCTPEEMDDTDWDMVRDYGEFFRRSAGDQLAGEELSNDFYGIAYQAGKAYDFNIMQINAFIWQHGADIWDETKAPEGQAEGVVNSEIAVEALEHYLSLLEYMPPVVETGTMDIFKVDELFREGQVAWIIQWIGFAESTINSQTSKVADKVAF